MILFKYFSKNPEILFDKIDPAHMIWHENVPEREKRTGLNLQDKMVICNFRRLPSWIISRIQFEEKRSSQKTAREHYITGRFHEESGFLNCADYYVKKYTASPVRNWIRTEFIQEDFEDAFSPFLDLSRINLSGEFQRKSNVTSYERNLRKWFNREDLELLYSSCPLWRDLELRLYGDLITL